MSTTTASAELVSASRAANLSIRRLIARAAAENLISVHDILKASRCVEDALHVLIFQTEFENHRPVIDRISAAIKNA